MWPSWRRDGFPPTLKPPPARPLPACLPTHPCSSHCPPACCREGTPQCFLLTPKLLPDLPFSKDVTVLQIMNGGHVQEVGGRCSVFVSLGGLCCLPVLYELAALGRLCTCLPMVSKGAEVLQIAGGRFVWCRRPGHCCPAAAVAAGCRYVPLAMVESPAVLSSTFIVRCLPLQVATNFSMEKLLGRQRMQALAATA